MNINNDSGDGNEFTPLTPRDIAEVLSLTIKGDYENKIITFLCQLSSYTEDAQFNVAFNSPSSTGKSYIALEVSKLFPSEDVIKLGNCSKTAFFHEQGVFDKENNKMTIDMSRKILIFTDMPHTGLLEGLRSFLSHDEKVMISKITDKGQKGGNKTKTIALIGYPSVIFCTAGLRMDAQEQTRFILLSPEVNQEKLRAGISNAIMKEIDGEAYRNQLEGNALRRSLKLRIQAIRDEHIEDIKIVNEAKISERFLRSDKKLQPRHQRDVKRFMSIVKAFALLNLWWRKQEGSTIIANDEDIRNALEIWNKVSVSQELNVSPFIYELFAQVIVPTYWLLNTQSSGEKVVSAKRGITRQDILEKHHRVYGRPLDPQHLRQQILPILEGAGLIYQEQDRDDRRKTLIFPIDHSETVEKEENSVNDCGVKNNSKDDTEIPPWRKYRPQL